MIKRLLIVPQSDLNNSERFKREQLSFLFFLKSFMLFYCVIDGLHWAFIDFTGSLVVRRVGVGWACFSCESWSHCELASIVGAHRVSSCGSWAWSALQDPGHCGYCIGRWIPIRCATREVRKKLFLVLPRYLFLMVPAFQETAREVSA